MGEVCGARGPDWWPTGPAPAGRQRGLKRDVMLVGKAIQGRFSPVCVLASAEISGRIGFGAGSWGCFRFKRLILGGGGFDADVKVSRREAALSGPVNAGDIVSGTGVGMLDPGIAAGVVRVEIPG